MEKELEELEIITEEDVDKDNTAKMKNRDFYVYKHSRLDNNTCFYVGKGKGKRAYKPKRNKFYNNVRNSCGCKVVIIKNNLTEEEAFNLETEVIEDYVFVFGYGINIEGYRDFSNNYLTNFTWGGEGVSGYKFSEEQKQNLRTVIIKQILILRMVLLLIIKSVLRKEKRQLGITLMDVCFHHLLNYIKQLKNKNTLILF